MLPTTYGCALFFLLLHHCLAVGGPSDALRLSERPWRFSHRRCRAARCSPASPSDGDEDCGGPGPWAEPPRARGDDAGSSPAAAAHRPPTSAASALGVGSDAPQSSRHACAPRGAGRLRRPGGGRSVASRQGGLGRRLSLRREAAERAAAWAHPRPLRVDSAPVPGGAVEDPRGLGHHPAGREETWGDAPRAHRGTSPALLGRWLQRQPVVPLGTMRQALGRAATRHPGHPPGCARPGPRAQAMARGRQRQGAADR